MTAHDSYQCIAHGAIAGQVVVTTNDARFFGRLLRAGATVLCHPALFGGQSEEATRTLPIPYSVCISRDTLARIQAVPTGKHESYETLLYCLARE